MAVFGCNEHSYREYSLYNARRDAHCHCGTGSTSIFMNCSGGGCGGGGFWGGFGAGFGLSLGNWFGGMLGGFCNMFGGWGMNNMFGMGGMFGGFGNMFGLGNMYGGWGVPTWGTSSTTTTTTPKDDDYYLKYDTSTTPAATTPADDKDYQKINAIVDKATKLTKPDCTNETAVSTYNSAIDAIINELKDYTKLDEISTKQNDEQIENAKTLLGRLKVEYKPNNDVVNFPEDFSNLTDEDLNNIILNFSEFPDDKCNDLKTQLQNDLTEYKIGDNNYKISRSYTDLLKLELLCKLDPSITVNVEKYENASDQFIKGSIKDVKKDANGNITYWVDCANTGEEIKAQWLFKTEENSNKASIIGTIQGENGTSYSARIGMDYEWSEGDGYYINKNNKTTGSTKV